MDRKLKDLMKSDDNAMLDAVCASAHQIWQAGLGAFARAQQEGGDLFDKLVQEGGELQKLSQRLTGEKSFSVTDTVTRLAGNASRQASGSWDKLEKIFEERVSRSLRTLGMPSPEDVQVLSRDMAELKAALRKVGQHSQGEIDALKRAVTELKASIGTVQNKPAGKKTAARPAAQAPARAPAKVARKDVAKVAAKVAAKVPAKVPVKMPVNMPVKRAAARRPAAKKTAQSARGAA